MIAMTTAEMLQWLDELSACYPNSEKVKAIRHRLDMQHKALTAIMEHSTDARAVLTAVQGMQE